MNDLTNNLPQQRIDWEDIAVFTLKIDYFAVPRQDHDHRVQEANLMLSRYNLQYGRPFRFDEIPPSTSLPQF